MGENLVARLRQYLRREWTALKLRRLIDTKEGELIRLGSANCGYTVPAMMVQPGAVAVCVGVGEDMSFDVELNKRGLNVYTLDPTPRSKIHVHEVVEAVRSGKTVPINRSSTLSYDLSGFDVSRFTYRDVGLWSRDQVMRFFVPKNESHVSHSIVNLQKTDSWFEAKCMTLQSFCDSHGIDRIDILKLDVEGAEHEIINSILGQRRRPRAFCFDFDELHGPIDGAFMDRIHATIAALKRAGYCFRHVESSNVLFLNNEVAGEPQRHFVSAGVPVME